MTLDGLYEVVERTSSEASVLLSDENHPVFKAHFENNPILPGFVHLEIIADIFDVEITGVKKAKFNNLVRPLQTLLYVRDGQKIKVTSASKDIASFSIV